MQVREYYNRHDFSNFYANLTCNQALFEKAHLFGFHFVSVKAVVLGQ